MKKTMKLLIVFLLLLGDVSVINAKNNSETVDPQYSVISIIGTERIPRTFISCSYAGYTYFFGEISATIFRRATDNAIIDCTYSIKLYNIGGENALDTPIELFVTNKSYYVLANKVHVTFTVVAKADSYSNSISFDKEIL